MQKSEQQTGGAGNRTHEGEVKAELAARRTPGRECRSCEPAMRSSPTQIQPGRTKFRPERASDHREKMDTGQNQADSYTYVLFDLDGTLTDSAPGIIASLRYALERGGIAAELIQAQDLHVFLGPPLRESFPKYFQIPPQRVEELIMYYRERFERQGMFENRVYEGVPAMLLALKNAGKKIILATAKPEVYARKILAHFDLLPYFDFVCGTSLDASRDTKAAVIAACLAHFSIPGQQAVMVGDRYHDAAGARENQIDCIGVLYGYGSAEELRAAGAGTLAATPQQVAKQILSGRSGLNQPALRETSADMAGNHGAGNVL